VQSVSDFSNKCVFTKQSIGTEQVQ